MKLASEVVRRSTCTYEVRVVDDLAVDFVALSANTAKGNTWNMSLEARGEIDVINSIIFSYK